MEGKRFPPPRFLKTLMTPPDKIAQDFSIRELLDEIHAAEEQRAGVLTRIENPTESHLRLIDRRIATSRIELQRRFAVPLACLCFALLAVPLGMTTARSGKGAGFAMSVVVIVAYRLVFVAATNRAMLGHIPADLGPWVANALVLVWALLAYWRMRRRSVHGGVSLWKVPFDIWRRTRARLRRARTEAAPVEQLGDDVSGLAGLTGTTRRFVGRLDRYVAMAFLRIFAFSLVATYLIYAVVEGQGLVDQSLRTNQSLRLVADYLLYFPPGVLHVVMPIACLIGAVVSVTLLSRSQELVAVKAAGVSMRRVTVPIVLLSLLLGALVFLVQDRIAPAANRMAQETKDRIHRRAPRTHGMPRSGSWRFGSDGRTLHHFVLHDASKDEYQGLSVFTIERAGPRIVDHRFSDRARFDDGVWVLDKGWYRSFSPLDGDSEEAPAAEIESPLTRYEEPYSLALDISPDLVEERRWLHHRAEELPDQMSLTELSQQIDSLRNSGYDITKLRVAYHRKFAQALSPLVMVLLGLPFAFGIGRRGSLYGIGVALVLELVYWATFAVFNALGLETVLPPLLAAWGPNVLYALLGTYLLLYVRT
jgi:LPS export ABC transporter permease LptG